MCASCSVQNAGEKGPACSVVEGGVVDECRLIAMAVIPGYWMRISLGSSIRSEWIVKVFAGADRRKREPLWSMAEWKAIGKSPMTVQRVR